jgi:ParB family chromosome partitioning protein
VLIDGHLRAETTPRAMVPVLVLDVTEAEADKILATLDPLAALAGADADQLEALLRQVSTGDEALRLMLEQLATDAGVKPPEFEPASFDDQGKLGELAPITCPKCGHVFQR